MLLLLFAGVVFIGIPVAISKGGTWAAFTTDLPDVYFDLGGWGWPTVLTLVDISNDLRGSLKFDWQPQAEFSPFVFLTASRDEIRKLDSNIVGGLGAKWTVLRRAKVRLSLSGAGLLDYENFALDPGSSSPASQGVFRASGRPEIGPSRVPQGSDPATLETAGRGGG